MPNQRLQPTAFNADMRGAFCLYMTLVRVTYHAGGGGG